jgi:hypothetical protein
MSLLDTPQPRTPAPAERPLSRSRVLIAVLIAAVLIVAGVGGQMLRNEPQGDTRRSASSDRPARGAACPSLAQAYQLVGDGKMDAFVSTIEEAARVAERTLDRSGQTFGRPERLAIQLSYDIQNARRAAVIAGLQKAAQSCLSIGRWPDEVPRTDTDRTEGT